MWRKNRQPTKSIFCTGTDINRNFGYGINHVNIGWSKPGASSNLCSEAYYGDSSFSTNEATAISNYILESRPIAYIGTVY
jgi:carboxypeptidase A1